MNTETSTIIELLKKLDQRLEKVEALVKSSNQTQHEEEQCSNQSPNQYVKEFDLLLENYISPLVECSKTTAQPEFIRQIDQLVNALNQERVLVELASKFKKPNQDTLLELVKPINSYASVICQIRDTVGRKSSEFNSLSAISESIGFLSWVILDKTPRLYVEEMRHAAEFYTNKVLVDNRGKSKDQFEWVNHYLGFLSNLESYIKKYHLVGLSWNSNGPHFKSQNQNDSMGSLPSVITTSQIDSPNHQLQSQLQLQPQPQQINNSTKSNSSNAVLNDINSLGEKSTGNLKRVESKSKPITSLSSSSSSSSSSPSSSSSSLKSSTASPSTLVKQPKIVNNFDKWVIEHQVNNNDISILVLEKRQSVYIYKCNNTIIQIKGKVNQIIMNDCKKTSIVFDDVISSCQIVNCSNSEIQVLGYLPSISIDKSSGCQIYLSKLSIGTQIITSKSSEMNVLVPNSSEGDMIEIPIPEQFVSTIKNNKLFTESTTHS